MPYCASRIPDVAIVCRFCGRQVTPVSDTRHEPQGASATTLIRAASLALLLVLALIALLYAYRAGQSSSGTPVPYSQALTEIQGGQVQLVTFNTDTATIDLFAGARQTLYLGASGRVDLMKVIADHNATVPPNQRITVAASGACC